MASPAALSPSAIMEDDVVEAAPAPRPRPFPAGGPGPGPRCGHTLTAIASSSDGLASARLVMFGAWGGGRALGERGVTEKRGEREKKELKPRDRRSKGRVCVGCAAEGGRAPAPRPHHGRRATPGSEPWGRPCRPAPAERACFFLSCCPSHAVAPSLPSYLSPLSFRRRRDRARVHGPPRRGPARLARPHERGWHRYVLLESARRCVCVCVCVMRRPGSALCPLSPLSPGAHADSSPLLLQASASRARPRTSTSLRSAPASGPRSPPRASRPRRGRPTRRRRWGTWWSSR